MEPFSIKKYYCQSMRLPLLILFLAILLKPQVVSAQCDLKTNKDGIKVYTCELKDSKYKAVKSTFELKSTLSEFVAAVLDIDRHVDWEYKTLNARLLKKISDHEVIFYTEAAAPVLTSNRDFVIHLTLHQDPQTKEVTIDLVSEPDYIPAKENIIRVPFSKARFKAKEISPSMLLIDYYIEIDLGGDVPPWMVNMVADKAPYETFKSLRGIIGTYKGKGTSFVKN
jgi:START domain